MPFRTLLEFAAAALGTPAGAVLAAGDNAWREMPAAELDRRSAELAAALVTYGLTPGARVAVLTGDGNEALFGLLAVLRAGGTVVPLDPGLPDAGLLDALGRTSARQILASDDVLLQRILSIRPELPELDIVLLFRGSGGENRAAALTVSGACTVGKDALARQPGLLRREAPEETPPPAVLRFAHDGEILAFTDGNALAAIETAGAALRIERDETVLSALPASDAAHLVLALVCLARGARLAHLAPPERLGEAMLDVHPAVAVLPGSLAGALRRHLEAAVGAESWLGGKLLRFALRQGSKRGALDLAAGRLPAARSFGFRVAEALVIRRIARASGGRLKRLASLGKPLPVVESSFFLWLGVPFLEGLALPEAGGLVAMNRTDALRAGTAGRLVPGLEGRVGADGAFEIRGPMVAGGTWRSVPFRGRLDKDGYLTGTLPG
jgi:long-chain acyl-CoA synthetase